MGNKNGLQPIFVTPFSAGALYKEERVNKRVGQKRGGWFDKAQFLVKVVQQGNFKKARQVSEWLYVPPSDEGDATDTVTS